MYIWIRNIIFITLLTLLSCKRESACWHSYGDNLEVTPYIELDSFKSIVLDGNEVYLNLINDSINYFEIIGGENSSKHINYNIENEELTITNDNKCEWLRNNDKRITIDLHFKNLRDIRNLGDGMIASKGVVNFDTISIHQNGTGNISLNVNTKRIWVDMYVVGDVELKGNCESLIALVGSFGNFKAKNLMSDWINVKTIHEGDAYVYPLIGLNAVCEQIGDIYYYNKVDNPIIEETKEGKVEFVEE